METFDAIGHCAIGLGELHAISTFVANDYTPTLDHNHVLALTYEAKPENLDHNTILFESPDLVIREDRSAY